MKKKLLLMAACLGAMFAFTACGSKDDGNTLTVLNYGKYIESSVLDAFEEETGIHVNYEEYIFPDQSRLFPLHGKSHLLDRPPYMDVRYSPDTY